jgi:hypothetical protein
MLYELRGMGNEQGGKRILFPEVRRRRTFDRFVRKEWRGKDLNPPTADISRLIFPTINNNKK